MPTTTTLIAAQTVTTATNSISFSSIPQTFTGLKLVCSVRTTNASVNGSVVLGFNGTSNSTNWSVLYLEGSGSSVSTGTGTTGVVGYPPGANATASTFGSLEVNIPNYTASINKALTIDSVMENNATTAYADFLASLWSNTSAISSIQITPGSGNFAVGSSFYLYGVSSDTSNQIASGPYAFGGDVVTTDGSYWYHTFLSSNSFTPLKNLSNVDFLVVAGGGGGGSVKTYGTDGGPGGGAGGLRSTVTATGGGGSLESKLTLTANTPYACVIGAGGAGGTNDGRGASGGSSIFGSITSAGGGGGGGFNNGYGIDGGSGGGGTGDNGANRAGGAASPSGQGYAGGNANSSSGAGGGGGGAGGAGTAGTSGSNGADGGLALAVAISGSSIYYAGGGGGGSDATAGTAGLGGGTSTTANKGGAGNGFASTTTLAQSGTSNTGGGGGGGGAPDAYELGGNGGSGIIIIRYAV